MVTSYTEYARRRRPIRLAGSNWGASGHAVRSTAVLDVLIGAETCSVAFEREQPEQKPVAVDHDQAALSAGEHLVARALEELRVEDDALGESAE